MNFNSFTSRRLRRMLFAALMIFGIIAALIGITLPVHAQNGFNHFEEPRMLVLQSPTILTVADAPRTTMPFDLSDFDGTATIYIFTMTNDPRGTLTVAVEDSVLGTNAFSAISNCAYGTSATLVSSNVYLTNLKASNTMVLPGTIVTPTAATAGFATPYLLGAPYTNTVSALTATASGWQTIGVNLSGTRRYLHVVFTTGGTATNITVGAIMVGRPRQPRYF